MPSIVDAERLSKTFQVKVRDPGLRGALRALLRPRYRDVHAVRDVTFRIDPGEIVAFLGPNGAGKTTTLKMLAGLLYATSGRVEAAALVARHSCASPSSLGASTCPPRTRSAGSSSNTASGTARRCCSRRTTCRT